MQRAGKASEGETKRLASRLASAAFVSLRCSADGDALAATGILARALGTIETPFQATVHQLGGNRETATDADLVVRVGFTDPVENTGHGSIGDDSDSRDSDDSADDSIGSDSTDVPVVLSGDPTPASRRAIGAAYELNADPDPVLALAGGVAAAVRDTRDPFEDDSAESEGGGEEVEHSTGSVPTLNALFDRAREDGRLGDRRPGIALPAADVVDGLAYTTLAHTTVSGNTEAARERCGSLAAAENGREIASLLACSVVGTQNASPRAARTVEQALRPVSLPDSSTPFATLEGYADVLGTVAAERPGIGLALACGYDVHEAALSAWRTHAGRAHAALRSATHSRYDGLCVARLAGGSATDPDGTGHSDGDDSAPTPVATIARLLRDFRSPEPIALVVDDGLGAIAAIDDRGLGGVVARAAHALDGTGGGGERFGECRFCGSNDELVSAVRAELADESRTDRGEGDGPRSIPSRGTGDRS